MLILIAGPYRSGTGDDPAKMAENLKRLEEPSYALFRAGHVPVIGEWVALPVWHAAGGTSIGDDLYEEIFHPVAGRLLALCDAVLRLPGDSKGRTMMSALPGSAAFRSITTSKMCPAAAKRRSPERQQPRRV